MTTPVTDQGAPTTTAAPDPSPHSEPAYDPAAFWDARLRARFDLAGVGFRGFGKPFNNALYRQREWVLRRTLRKHGIRVRGGAVVELGPGTGFYVDIWRRLGAARIVGLDVAAVSVERLSQRWPQLEFRVADIRRPWAVDAGAFDIVTAFDVLFHVTDDAGWEAAIEQAALALRPGGWFLISDLFPQHEPYRAHHQASRLLRDYLVTLARHGFDVRGRTPVFVTMHPPYDLPPTGFRARLAWRWWRWLDGRVQADRAGAGVLGDRLARVDRILARVLRGGPSTELLVARRR